jgi:NADPH-dependent curcumin reductase CurA
MVKTRQWLFTSHPDGKAQKSDFTATEIDLPELKDGEVLVKHEVVSVDPYMRGRMNETKTYAANFEKGSPVPGGAVGRVVESKSPDFQVGDVVSGFGGWQEYSIGNAKTLRKVPNTGLPLSNNLGVVGMTGVTAYVGLLDFTNPKEGETVLVSTAAGAVGSIVGQIAKIKGCRVVGITSSDEKTAFLKTIGYDEVINYNTCGNLAQAIAAACPKGIDIYFDNVGGETLEIAIDNINKFGRVTLCGAISQYEAKEKPKGPNLAPLIGKEVKIQGFIVGSYLHRFPEAITNLAKWVHEGKIKSKETVFNGFDAIPDAFLSLFQGSNIGKVVVQL